MRERERQCYFVITLLWPLYYDSLTSFFFLSPSLETSSGKDFRHFCCDDSHEKQENIIKCCNILRYCIFDSHGFIENKTLFSCAFWKLPICGFYIYTIVTLQKKFQTENPCPLHFQQEVYLHFIHSRFHLIRMKFFFALVPPTGCSMYLCSCPIFLILSIYFISSSFLWHTFLTFFLAGYSLVILPSSTRLICGNVCPSAFNKIKNSQVFFSLY